MKPKIQDRILECLQLHGSKEVSVEQIAGRLMLGKAQVRAALSRLYNADRIYRRKVCVATGRAYPIFYHLYSWAPDMNTEAPAKE